MLSHEDGRCDRTVAGVQFAFFLKRDLKILASYSFTSVNIVTTIEEYCSLRSSFSTDLVLHLNGLSIVHNTNQCNAH